MTGLRIGCGYDVHRLVENRRLMIGGVEIPFEKGLDGHSDADVLVHAIMDALLGAAGMPDIGQQFPDSAEAYENISSLLLLEKVEAMLRIEGYSIVNIDSTIVAQRPKMSDYIGQMKQLVAKTLGCDPSRVNIKATTEEKLGFTGQGLGIAAQAVALIEK